MAILAVLTHGVSHECANSDETLFPQAFQPFCPVLRQLSSRREQIGAEVAAIKQREGTALGIALMVADYYQNSGDLREPAAYWQTIATLEGVKGETAIAWRRLGESYLRLGWLEEAEASYKQGLRLAIRSQNETEMGHTQAGLGHVFAARRDLAESQRWLEKAQMDYQTAGDAEEAEVVSRWLEVVKVLSRGDRQ